MNISVYLRILKERLEEANIESEIIEKVLLRENSMVEGASERELQSLVSFERLEIIVASTVSRVAKESLEKITVPTENKKNVVIQDSCFIAAEEPTPLFEKTVSLPQKNLRSEEKTILPEEKKVSWDQTVKIQKPFRETATETLDTTLLIPLKIEKKKNKPNPALFSSNTQTIVISDKAVSQEEDTVVVPSKLEKLFADTATVRISEKETVSFTVNQHMWDGDDEDATRHDFGAVKDPVVFLKNSLQDGSAEILDDSTTTPMPFVSIKEIPVSVPTKESDIPEQTRPLPRVDRFEADTNSPKEKPKGALSSKETEAIITAESLHNPYAKQALIWLCLLAIPSFLFGFVLFGVYYLLGNLFLLLAFSLVILLYLALTVLPLVIALYSVIMGIVYFTRGSNLNGLLEVGIGTTLSSVALVTFVFLFKPVLFVTQKLYGLIWSFNRKNLVFLRALFRYMHKGVGCI